MKKFITEIRECFDNSYLKVFVANLEDINTLQEYIENLESVKKVNVTLSESSSHRGETLTVYPKPIFDIKEVEKQVVGFLNTYYDRIVIVPEQIVTESKFNDIRVAILGQLDKASTSIYICVAWFTDDTFKEILKQKIKDKVDVRVIIYDDGINKKHGVNLEDIPNKKLKAEHHGIMHRKYCIIDNHVVISGSYNLTDNAATRNDENIIIVEDWKTANEHTREFLNHWLNNEI